MNLTKEKHATHTPGPWHVRLGEDYYHVHGEVQVALVENWTVEDPRGNARLIASAPELLSQCKLFEKVLTHLINSGDSGADLERDKLREVLAKVDGSRE